MGEYSSLGPWARLRILGRGGFGLVTLWRNQLTNEHIAIKCLRENELQGVIKPKHKERWCNEVEIMHKLKHKNVVAALPIPEQFSIVQSTVPLLAMEYCKLGDLRQVLVKPENCCGLKEFSVKNILRDVSSGLSYLHSCKVIHRDLKPDNIVLQEENGTIVYKLIDLGYAKELDQSSLCESFVGTVQYLAPELFLGKPYTSCVDYWSFGLVAHEVMTGHRPFLPGLPPVAWMKEIQNKKRAVISVFENWNSDIIHSSSLSRVNNISSCLREDFEKWLQLALDWDGKSRGRDLETLDITFFTALNKILEKEVIRVFSLPTCEVLSYVICKDTSVANLQSCITRDTGLEADDQTLLLPGGRSLSPKAILLNCLPAQRSSEDITIFLFSTGLIKMRSKTVLKPLFVRELLEDPRHLLTYQHLKRSSSDSVFFLQAETNVYQHVLGALKAKVENIKERSTAVETLYEDVVDEWNQVEACLQFFILSHKADLENYIEFRKSGALPSSSLVQKLIKKASDLEAKVNELRVSSDRAQKKDQIEAAKLNSIELVNHSLMGVTDSTLDEVLKEGHNLYDRVQKIPKDVRGHPMSNTDMVRVIYKCMEASAKLLRSSDLSDLFLKIFESEDHLAKLISPLTIVLKSTKIMRQIIENTQRERQREVWGLIINNNAQKPPQQADKINITVTNGDSPEPKKEKSQSNGKFSPFHIPKTVNQELASPLDENMIRPDFRVSGPVSFSLSVPSLQSNSSVDVSSDVIIQTNNDLRYRAHDLTQSCHSMVKEIQSFNWDFLDK